MLFGAYIRSTMLIHILFLKINLQYCKLICIFATIK
uniref:Uncharacterized protein n=1 Tax=Siphoviridae sp. ctTXt1 TaxID=2825520 RepID=A0A8S5P8Z9_9CAUD|nr:MAG TPA: hypothetical protein [Siphoviridae sp. ctTXt1]